MVWQKSKKTSLLISNDFLVPLCVKARVKAFGYSREGDGRRQPWSTEMSSKKICICNREKNPYFKSSKFLSVFSHFLRNVLRGFS